MNYRLLGQLVAWVLAVGAILYGIIAYSRGDSQAGFTALGAAFCLCAISEHLAQ